MMKFDYKTRLIWCKDKSCIVPFYKVNKGAGLVPAGIDIVYRGQRYTTSHLLDLISSCRKALNTKFKAEKVK